MRSTAGTVAFAIVLGALPAAAQTRCAQQAEAARLEAEGFDLRGQNRDAEAMERFRRAHALCGGASALGRLGVVEGAQGRFVEAEQHIREALTAGATDAWVVENRRNLENALNHVSARLGTLELTGDGPAAEVMVGGEARGRWPAQRVFRVVAGSVTYALQAPGCRATTRTVNVPAQGRVSEPVTLACDAAPSRGGTQRTLAWVSGGAAVVALGVGAVALGVYVDRLSTWNDDAVCFLPNGRSRRANCSAEGSTIDVALPMTWVGFGAAAALGVTSALLFATAPSGDTARASALRLQCGPGPGELGVACGGRF